MIEGETPAAIVLDRTVFYGESGGQVGDTGILRFPDDSVFEVESAQKTADGHILHIGRTLGGSDIAVGQSVHAQIDIVKRAATMRNHTAAHLLQAALRETLGTHVEQAGQLVNSHAVRFDFTHFSALTGEEIDKIERRVNEIILEGMPVTTEEMPIDEAKKLGAMALFGEKYGDIVRVVRAGDFSTELCGGTHVDNTGKLGLFKIVSESSVAAGVRRIEGVTGFGVMDYIRQNAELIRNTAAAMKLANPAEIDKRATSLVGEIKSAEKEIEKLRGEISSMKTGDLMQNAVQIGDYKLITATVEGVNPGELRNMADKAKDDDSLVMFICGINEEKTGANFACACGKNAVAGGAHAGNLVRKIASLAGGSGGGRPDSAMAGTKDITNIGSAMASVAGALGEMLK